MRRLGVMAGHREITAEDVTEIVGLLEGAGVGYWLDGGWGVDALLGEQTRRHDDLDLIIDVRQSATVQGSLDGFRHDPTVRPGLPARLVLVDGKGRQIDVHPVYFDDAGNGWQDLSQGAWALYPASGLGGEGRIAGHLVSCLAAELQLTHHLGYPWDDHDRADMTALAARFGLSLPPASGKKPI